jgi:putative ABC transport system permease protein
MIKNLFVVAMRNLRKYPGYSLLNICGLMIGITFSLLLIFYIRDELSYDRYHTNAERIYRVNSFIQETDRPESGSAITPFPTAPALQAKLPEVEQAVRVFSAGRIQFKTGNKRIFQDDIYFADSNFFKVFSATFIEGNPNTALVEPKSIVINETVANKYFGTAHNVVGKTLTNPTGDILTVKAVTKDIPFNSHLVYTALISRSTLPADYSSHWGNFGFYTYVLLKTGTAPAAFEKKLSFLYDEYLGPVFKPFNVKIRFEIQKITDIHLHSTVGTEPGQTGSMSYIYTFSAVVLFMLLIACINYMNLATARSARRAKEIGIRKVTGSSRSQLVAQFLVESTLITIVAMLLSIGLTLLFLPLFNLIAGKQIPYSAIVNTGTLLIMLVIIIVVGLTGGSYPALYLSRLQPVQVLKGTLTKNSGNALLRKVLVVTQFTVALIMLICTWVVDRQLNYLRSRDLGFTRQQIVKLTPNTPQDVRPRISALLSELRKLPGVRAVSSSSATPGEPINFNLFSIQNKNGFIDQGIDNYAIDENFLSTLGIPIVRGRGFSPGGDTLRSIIVNEKMAEQFGWSEPIGKKVKYPGDTSGYYLEVVGVAKNFHQKSLYNPITPLMLFYGPNSPTVQVKINADHIERTLASIRKKWSDIFPDLEFSYTFLDEQFNSQYAADQRRGKIYTAFSVLTIIITCLGLLGLIAFITEQRQKEISIRKVLGAGLSQLVPMITRNFVALVGIACLVAFPVAYLFMSKWLQVFPYNTGISVLPFFYSAVTVLLITLTTVMFHMLKAALASPAKSLKTE